MIGPIGETPQWSFCTHFLEPRDANKPITENIIRGETAPSRERFVNIWWKGSAKEVLGKVREQFPDAYPQGKINANGQLQPYQLETVTATATKNPRSKKEKPIPSRGRKLPVFDGNGQIPNTQSATRLRLVVTQTAPTEAPTTPQTVVTGRPMLRVVNG